MTRDLSVTINSIYEAVDEPQSWPAAVEKIGRLLRSDAGGLSFETLPPGPTAMNVSYGFEPGLIAEYNGYYHSVNLPLQRARPFFATGAVLTSHDVCSDGVFSESEYYRDCLKKWDLFYIVAGVVTMSPGNAGLVQFLRARRQGPFTTRERAVLAALNPHLNRALRLHDAAITLGATLKALDQVATAVVLLNRHQRVVYMNRSASEVFMRRDGFLLEKGFVVTAISAARASFRELVATSLSSQASIEAGALRIERSSGKRAYSVVVSPMGTSFQTVFDSRPAIAIFILDPEQSVASLPQRLRQLHGLTLMEANLAAVLVTGEDLSQACDALGITRNTGRAHLRSIFAKMNVKRQSELVSVLIRSSLF